MKFRHQKLKTTYTKVSNGRYISFIKFWQKKTNIYWNISRSSRLINKRLG